MCRTALAAGHTTAMLAAAISRLAPDDVGSLPTSSPLQLSCSAAVNVLTLKMPMSSLAYFNYLCFTHVRCSRLLRTATVKLLGKVTLQL